VKNYQIWRIRKKKLSTTLWEDVILCTIVDPSMIKKIIPDWKTRGHVVFVITALPPWKILCSLLVAFCGRKMEKNMAKKYTQTKKKTKNPRVWKDLKPHNVL